MNKPNLDYVFHPQSIAVVGVSSDPERFNNGKGFLHSIVESGFKGAIYPVNPGGGEVYGLTIYKSIEDTPGPIDYVISAIPAKYALQLVDECAKKGVKTIHFFTAGFSEIEDETGKQLESQVLEAVRKGGIRIIGPNCVGIYNPKVGISFCPDFPRQVGGLGLLAQSGGNSNYLIRIGEMRGIYFSKAISYGNAADLSECDFLEYFIDDPETKVIAAYIEGITDGDRFMRLLRRATKLKPVIIFKAGATESGMRAAASHTASLAGVRDIWDSAMEQTGVIQVHSLDEMMDVALLFTHGFSAKGRDAVLIGPGGGASVWASDDCSNAGLNLPMLSDDTRQELHRLYPAAGRIFGNPIDVNDYLGPDVFRSAMKVINEQSSADFIIIHVPFDASGLISKEENTREVEPYVDAIVHSKDTIKKPAVIAFHSCVTDISQQLALEVHHRLRGEGFPVYPSIIRAAYAISKCVQYREWRGE